jgi:hypothetical protein
MGVKHGTTYATEANEHIESFTKPAPLEAYRERWEGKLLALDTILKSPKYHTEEGSPSERVFNLINERIQELTKGDE